MATTYRYRAYEDGDHVAINELYARIKGVQRSFDEFKWQWMSAPGGMGEVWLIEAIDDEENVSLIGHHGVMPIRFTNGDDDLLFGKTENTMVLPEYQRKILYPRFEKKIALFYEPRFDALFSTMGPAAAIRQRLAQGYTLEKTWISFEYPIYRWSYFTKFKHNYLIDYLKFISRKFPSSYPKSCSLLALNSDEVKEHLFFDDFWSKQRKNAGISPRRDKEDLSWRFWDNPYNEYTTLLFSYESVYVGYAILEMGENGQVSLSDFYLSDFSMLKVFFRTLKTWVSCNTESYFISYHIVTDSYKPSVMKELDSILNRSLFRFFKKTNNNRFMPRKVTKKGFAGNVSINNWNITPMLFEGR